MKFEDLSPEDQALVKTDFGAELEKQAAAEVAEAQELYAMGFEKMAAADAEAMDKEKEEEEKEEANKPEKKLNEEQKKEASAKGAFIARGYIDGLMEKGASLHQDPLHYLYPAIAEVLVKEGADAGKVSEFLGNIKKKVSEGAAKAKESASAAAAKAKEHAGAAASKVTEAVKTHPKSAIGAGIGAAGLGAYGLHKYLKGKKE